ncbi:MAG: Mut7-C ubiquitin/RNAse domain-containing protein [Proteobacteria bacterium]|nr:Mut7-C ubiquitin/RNAse domain-containing protein [Pseudomonadota bacterium]
MNHVHLHFSSPLLSFLKRKHQKPILSYNLQRKATIKDIIESLGVPHTEIGHIFADNREIDFCYRPSESRSIHIRHVDAPFNVFKPSLLRKQPLKEFRFIVDVNVGKLSQLLRLIGLDTAYIPDASDEEIAEAAHQQQRIVLTKDMGLLKRKKIIFGRFVKAIHPEQQLKEIVDFFGLKGPFKTFSRCLLCNSYILNVEKEVIFHRLEPKTKRYYSDFRICSSCGQIYWQGSHYEKLIAMLENISEEFVKGVSCCPANSSHQTKMN